MDALINRQYDEINNLKQILKQQNDVICKQNDIIDRQNSIIDKLNEQASSNKLLKIQKIGINFVNKLNCILSLRRTLLDAFFTRGIVGGSFIRQLFELPVSLAELFETPGYGNPIGRDIDIYIYKNVEDVSDNFIKTMDCKMMEINNYVRYHRIAPSKYPPVKFGCYELIKITDSTIFEIKDDDIVGKKNY